MKKVVFLMVAVGALAALGCDDKKPDAKPATAAATAHATAAPAKSAAPGGGW